MTEAVRRRPYQVVLFDEVEKAHPDVFNVLLQVLDDGILTDGQGRTVDFKQTLIILTSNLGAQALSQLPEGADVSGAKRDVMDAVRAHFRPEFLNRLDETIIFDRLNREDMDGIVDIQMARLLRRLAARKINLELDDGARKWLADEGYDPVFGARPLKRVIQTALQNSLAEMLSGGRFKRRGQHWCQCGCGRPDHRGPCWRLATGPSQMRRPFTNVQKRKRAGADPAFFNNLCATLKDEVIHIQNADISIAQDHKVCGVYKDAGISCQIVQTSDRSGALNP